MTRESVTNNIRQIAADIFGLPLEAITIQSSPENTDGWDSLQHVNLVLALEQGFDVQFLPEEIAEMLSIEIIVLLLEQKLPQLHCQTPSHAETPSHAAA